MNRRELHGAWRVNESKAKELGRRAVACKGWRWLPGMVDSGTGGRLIVTSGSDETGISGRWAEDETGDAWVSDWGQIDFYATPDFTDPATIGCTIVLIEELWSLGRDWIVIHDQYDTRDGRGVFEIMSAEGNTLFKATGGTRVERLVRALEAAPS